MIQLPLHETIIRHDQLDLIHGEILFLPNMPVTAIFLVEKGGVLVFSPTGVKISRTMVSGQVVGMQDLLCDGCWTGLGVAHGPTRLRAFSAERLRLRIAGAPEAHQALLRDLAAA